MNTEIPNNGTTRRSFIKRSVVAAVAVSTMTIFSGLVNAQTSGTSGTPAQTGTCGSGKMTKCCEDRFGSSDGGYTCEGYSGSYCDKSRRNATNGTCPADPPKP